MSSRTSDPSYLSSSTGVTGGAGHPGEQEPWHDTAVYALQCGVDPVLYFTVEHDAQAVLPAVPGQEFLQLGARPRSHPALLVSPRKATAENLGTWCSPRRDPSSRQ